MDEETQVEAPGQEQTPETKAPKIKLPKIDLRWVIGGCMVAAIAVVNTMLVLKFAAPTLILKDPRMQEMADEKEAAVPEEAQPRQDAKFPRHVLSPSMENRYNQILDLPEVDPTSYLHRQAFVAGAVTVGAHSYIGPQVSIRGDIAQGIRIGAETNLQDGVIISGLSTEDRGNPRSGAQVQVGDRAYSVYLEDRVTLAPQAQVYGPAFVGEGTYLGMQSLVFRSQIGRNCVLEPRSAAIGVTIAEKRCIPAGMLVNTQAQADALPTTENHPYQEFGPQSVEVYTELTKALRR